MHNVTNIMSLSKLSSIRKVDDKWRLGMYERPQRIGETLQHLHDGNKNQGLKADGFRAFLELLLTTIDPFQHKVLSKLHHRRIHLEPYH